MLLFVFVHMSDCLKKWKRTGMNVAECTLRSDLGPKLNFAKSEQKKRKVNMKAHCSLLDLNYVALLSDFFRDYNSFFLFSPCYAMGKVYFSLCKLNVFSD